MGAYHAGNFFFRRPDLFDSVIALSGVYDTQDMYGGYMDEVVYRNDPCASLSGMPQDHPYIAMFNQRPIIICVGQGAWEDQLLAGTRRLDQVLRPRTSTPGWITGAPTATTTGPGGKNRSATSCPMWWEIRANKSPPKYGLPPRPGASGAVGGVDFFCFRRPAALRAGRGIVIPSLGFRCRAGDVSPPFLHPHRHHSLL